MEPNQVGDGASPNATQGAGPTRDAPPLWSTSAGPGGSGRPWSKKIFVLAILIVLVGGCVAIAAALELTGQGGGIAYITFGTGGSECALDTQATTFPAGTRIRVAADYSPPLPAGSTVKITIWQDGRERTDLGGPITLEVDSNCLNGPVGALDPGHYRLEMAPSDWPPLSGEFDVTR